MILMDLVDMRDLDLLKVSFLFLAEDKNLSTLVSCSFLLYLLIVIWFR